MIDRRTGPLFFTLEELYNVPGMPRVRGIDLVRRLREQAEEMGAELVRDDVVAVAGDVGDFELRGRSGAFWTGRTVLLATGVARAHPTVDGDFRPCFKYAGKGNLFYCPDCEAPLVEGLETVVIAVGSADGGAAMAVGLSRYASRLRVLITSDTPLSAERAADLEGRGIELVRGAIRRLDGEPGRLRALELDDGSRLEAEAFFVSSPARGRNDLATQLGVELAETGHHAQPVSQRGDTNVPGVWVAGDLRPMSQQVAVAMGTGNIAALMIDQSLRKSDVGAVP